MDERPTELTRTDGAQKHERPEELRHDIERTRARLDHTAAALAERVLGVRQRLLPRHLWQENRRAIALTAGLLVTLVAGAIALRLVALARRRELEKRTITFDLRVPRWLF